MYPVGEYKGYNLYFSGLNSGCFIAKNSNNEEIGKKTTMEELKGYLDRLTKANWDPIKVIDTDGDTGKITSYNADESYYWLVWDKPHGGLSTTRTKRNLYSFSNIGLYHPTIKNYELVGRIKQLAKQRAELHKQIQELQEQFDGEVTKAELDARITGNWQGVADAMSDAMREDESGS